MPDAFISDTVRTPRGRGKADGSLHEVTARSLAAQALGAIKDRHDGLDPSMVEDVVMGCVAPVGEAGGDIARVAALVAGYGDKVPGIQINRFCASGLDAVNFAAAVLIGTKEAGAKAGLKPRARIRQFANIGSEPAIMLTGPAPVSEKVLKKAGMSKSDIDLWELNEAFASVVLRYMQALDIPHDKINVCGGAIAMGHPLGATGAMILGTVLDELERTGKQTALVTLCIGAGMGTATIIERV